MKITIKQCILRLNPIPLLWIIFASILINIIQFFFKKKTIIIVEKEIFKNDNINNNLEVSNENKLTLDEVNKRIESFKNKRILNKEIKENINENE
ncbi:MAG: hypothetical protein AM1032_000148 [Mycoplasmataceae bacterium]|nr:MAG: hypothetical protein AM1032_000148 [Mycoplasmataceae bacterium]